MEVRLIDYSRPKYVTMIKAMRRCMGHSYVSDTPTAEEVNKLVGNAVGRKHLSLLESSWFAFEILGISREAVDQFRTHRMLSFHVESSRRKMPEGIIVPAGYPPSIQNRYLAVWYRATVDYEWLRSHGVTHEDAKGVLPILFESSLQVEGNGRAWYEWLTKRLCRHTQKELRGVATNVQDALSGVMPEVFSAVKCQGCEENCGKKENK